MSQSSTLPFNFGGIDDAGLSSRESARVLVLPVAYEGTVSYGTGTAQGAHAIIDASRNMELYDEETDTEIYQLGIHTLPALEAEDTPEATLNNLYERVRELLAAPQADKFIVTIGGEHSITAPVVRAYKERYENLSVLQIDAHADLRETYDGTPYSHACVMRRITDDMKIPAVQCGIRSLSADEARAIKDLPTHIYWAKDTVGRDGWQEEAISHLTENVFLTIDVDGFDSSIMPHTGTPEPGGFTWYEVTKLIRTLAASRRIVGFDIVEYAPTEGGSASAFLCAKLIYKTLSYIFKGQTDTVHSA